MQLIPDAFNAGKVSGPVVHLLVGATPSTRDEAASAAPGTKRAYLKAITVEGFQGIGPKITLTLQPRPGLTVVTGPNGSEKSSFADLALTGENRRWLQPTAGWSKGWRNFHAPGATAISIQLTEGGGSGATTVTRERATGTRLYDAQTSIAPAGVRQPHATKLWTRALELCHSFLSYFELGALVSSQPPELYEAILALDVVTDSKRVLSDSYRSTESESKLVKQVLRVLLAKPMEYPTSGTACSGRFCQRGTIACRSDIRQSAFIRNHHL